MKKKWIIAGTSVAALAVAAAGLAIAAPGDRAARIDANSDGTISVAELEQRSAERFTRLDANKDGQLSREEMQDRRGRGDRPGRGPGGRFGMRGGPDGAPGGPGPLFQGADADRNGSVTQAEFTAEATKRFQQLDSNRDGQISRDEAQAVRGRFGAMAGQMGERRFAMLDADRNGTVSRAEFNANTSQRLAQVDANRDGKVTVEEFRNARPRARR